MNAPCRRRSRVLAERASGLPGWTVQLDVVRGRCLARRCPSRWGVYRVSIDLRSAASVDRVATVECALCHRVWRRVRAERALRHPDGSQAVLLTLILPGDLRRWYAKGRWHVEGSDGIVVRDASLSDADDAARDWRKRRDAYEAARSRVRARNLAEEAAAHEATMALLARLDARDRERANEEAAAAAREA